MNDCPRRYTQKKAAYRSVSPDVRKNPLRRVFAFGAQGKMNIYGINNRLCKKLLSLYCI
ncbi:Uncharacterised protein [Shigella flexneri]|nr:Uncharacterised protein [Shigella flexneri]